MKLKWKIFGYILAFCGLLLVILWLSQTVFMTDIYKAVRRLEINSAVAYIRENIENRELQSLYDDLLIQKDILVMETQEFKPPQKEYRSSMDAGFKQNSQNNNGMGRDKVETITRTEEFKLSNKETISLTFFAMITPVSATVSTLRVQLYVITAIMLLLSIALAFAIAKKVSKPIEQINQGAKVLASGDYNTHFSGNGFLEIQELSNTLNITASELSKVESLRRELLANISHDLRTPLALIYSYAEMMHDFPSEITPGQTQTIMDETTRLSTLVDDVLDISKLESGNLQLNRRTYNLTESIQTTVERVAKLVEKEAYRIQFIKDSDVYVNADEIKITQVFYNLLINAITHGGEDKHITVQQLVLINRVEIQVTDNGSGIAEDELPHIWNRYYKVDKVHKRPVTGTGLGLYIVKRIVDLHGGSCGVRSEAGRGSTFWFQIETEPFL